VNMTPGGSRARTGGRTVGRGDRRAPRGDATIEQLETRGDEARR
jgi:hypothetical protein